jgi:hypothetical protein
MADTICLLATALRIAARTSDCAAHTVLQQVCTHAALRLVRAVSLLHTFLASADQREAWCGLPLEVVELLLGHKELGVDVEESGGAALLGLTAGLRPLTCIGLYCPVAERFFALA